MRPKHFPKGLDDRQRDQDGEIRKKRGDTKVDTLRKEYGPNFAKGYRGNVQLSTVLKREGVESLTNSLRRKNKIPRCRLECCAWNQVAA